MMSTCSKQSYAGNSNAGPLGAKNYLTDSPSTLALFYVLDSTTQDTANCQAVFMSGAEYVALLSLRGQSLGGLHMPLCIRLGNAGNPSSGQQGATNYLMDSTGTANLTPLTLAKFVLPDTTPQDISQCSAVALSGADFASLSAPAGGSTGGSQVNVSAEIFIGAALVLCLAVGWIAGGQR